MMTVREFYKWAEENNALDLKMVYFEERERNENGDVSFYSFANPIPAVMRYRKNPTMEPLAPIEPYASRLTNGESILVMNAGMTYSKPEENIPSTDRLLKFNF